MSLTFSTCDFINWFLLFLESRNDPDYDPEDEQVLSDEELDDENLLSEVSIFYW